MARRYQPDELLRLSASPLVKKPDNLPPAEEWMGPIPDPTTVKKSNHGRDNSNQEAGGRRPSVFENRHTSRGSEDIVLGPPKTSFASASAARILGKSFDLNDKSSTANDGEDVKNERYNFRDKFFKDRELGDRDSDKRDTRFGGRRGGRDDRDDWGSGRQRRTFGSDELERKPRRNGDSDRWRDDHRDHRDHKDHRDHRDQDPNNDRSIRDRDGKFLPRRERDGHGRGRHEPSWFRDDGTVESGEIEDEKRPMRNREWRQNRAHGHDRDWNRGAKFEQDPEWMDSTGREDTKQAHTQEDFQRWKERMKAGSGQAPPVEEKNEPAVESGNGETWQQPETSRVDGELFSSLETPIDNSGFDNFFGLWGESKVVRDGTVTGATDLDAKKDTAPPKVQKASRFAGIFSPPAEPVNQQPEPPVEAKPQPERPASAEADQEGFQRILQMLGGNKSRNTTPQADSTMQPRPPPPAQPEQSMPPMFPSPSREMGNRQDYMTLPDSSPRNHGPGNMEGAPTQRPQKETPVHNRESEFLLQLMQQAKISPSANSQGGSQPPTAQHTPGVLNVPDLLGRPQGVQKQKTPTFLDDPAIANMQRPDSDQGRRRGTNAPPMGYFDDVPVSAAQNNQIAAEANKIRLQGPGQSSIGLQRPPGLEQVPPPPGWPSHQMPPPQQAGPGPGPNSLPPPPGIPNPPRNMNPGFPPGPMPPHGGMPPPQNERQILSRNVSGGGNGTPGGSSAAGFGPPPGMGAPPGYMNMQGPPPAFPPMGNAPDAMGRMPYGNQMYFGGGAGGPPPPQPPQPPQQPQQPQQSRHPVDMFGNGGNDGNVRLGAGMMGGPYR